MGRLGGIMDKVLWQAMFLALAAASAAEESSISQTRRAAVRRTVSVHQAAKRSAGAYVVPRAGAGSADAVPAATRAASSAGGASPASAPGAMVFSNGRLMSVPGKKGIGTTPKILRAASGAGSQNSGAVGPASAPRGYSATAAGTFSAPVSASGRIQVDAGKSRATAGQGIHQGEPDSAPSSGSSASSKDPLSSILSGLAGLFKDMANMFGGGSGGNNNGG